MIDVPHRASAAADAAEGFAFASAAAGPSSLGEALLAARQLARATEALGDAAGELATAFERSRDAEREELGEEERAFQAAVDDAVLSLRAAKEGLRRARRHASSVDAVSCFAPADEGLEALADVLVIEVRSGCWLRARREGRLYAVASCEWDADPAWHGCGEAELPEAIGGALELGSGHARDRAQAFALAALVIDALGDND
jgi:hypothetical protein